ncbi:MAG: PEP-CTERM sorting domain-containing protein [Chthonomonas sp.]|nr:PEP-CTERM sorting domain-containing protein [Chthonomonas sp.]
MNRVIFTSALLATVVSAAFAAPYTVKFKSTSVGQSTSIKFYGSSKNVFAGKLKFNNVAKGSDFFTVCADLAVQISGGQTYNVNNQFASASPLGIAKAGRIVAKHFNSANTNEKAAALQLAVWEAIYDTGSSPSFSSGNFKATVSTSVKNQAYSYYSAISTPGEALYLKATPTNSGQSQLTVVPEPAALAALVIGAGMIVLRRKKA